MCVSVGSLPSASNFSSSSFFHASECYWRACDQVIDSAGLSSAAFQCLPSSFYLSYSCLKQRYDPECELRPKQVEVRSIP